MERSLSTRTWLFIFGGVTIALLAGLFIYANSLRRETINKEIALYNQDQANLVTLSTGITKIKEALGIAQLERSSLEDVLANVIKARFGENGFETEDALFVALTEAYPQVTPELFAKAMDIANAERTAYDNSQRITIQMVGDYEAWLTDDILRSSFLNMMGFPSTMLRADRERTLYGQEALDAMRKLVLVQEARDATNSGVLEPVIEPNLDNEP